MTTSSYLHQRLAEGCWNARQLFAEAFRRDEHLTLPPNSGRSAGLTARLLDDPREIGDRRQQIRCGLPSLTVMGRGTNLQVPRCRAASP